MAIEWDETRTTKCRLVVLRDGQHADDATPDDMRAAGYVRESDEIDGLKRDVRDAEAEVDRVRKSLDSARDESPPDPRAVWRGIGA